MVCVYLSSHECTPRCTLKSFKIVVKYKGRIMVLTGNVYVCVEMKMVWWKYVSALVILYNVKKSVKLLNQQLRIELNFFCWKSNENYCSMP